MKTQQTDNPRIKKIHNNSGDYAIIDNAVIVPLSSTTRPPEQRKQKDSPLFVTCEKLIDDVARLQAQRDEARAQRDELLEVVKKIERRTRGADGSNQHPSGALRSIGAMAREAIKHHEISLTNATT